GAVVSLIITFWVLVTIFPSPSSNVQVIINSPCSVYVRGSLVVPSMVSPVQAFVVVGAAIVISHSATASASTGATGAVVFWTTTDCLAVVIFPFLSSKVHVIS